jgi:hypothetical protein
VLPGPGALRDVPAVELLEPFDELRLVDSVIHPEARALARRYPGRIVRIRADVAGCIAPLVRRPRAIVPYTLIIELGDRGAVVETGGATHCAAPDVTPTPCR